MPTELDPCGLRMWDCHVVVPLLNLNIMKNTHSTKKLVSVTLMVSAAFSWYFPTWSGLFFSTPQDVTSGDGRIVAAILIVGGLLLWYTKEDR